MTEHYAEELREMPDINRQKQKMTEPTQEQIKEFWERCGWKYKKDYHDNYWGDWCDYSSWISPDGKDTHRRDLWPAAPDLNNLFKYAIDWSETETVQFSKGDDEHHCWIYTKKLIGKPFYGNGETDEDALFWAIWEVIKK